MIKGEKGGLMKFKYLPYNKKLKDRARKLRNEMTPAEKKLWYEYLRFNKYGFLRQKIIKNFILDFYSSKLRLVIEVDGETHLEEKDIIYDKHRTKELEKLGLKILRFWNDDILEGFGEIINIIEDKINKIVNKK